MKPKKLFIFFTLAASLALLCFSTVSCADELNAVQDSHFNEEGELVQAPEYFKIQEPQQINFYVEVSGSMNGFFRGNYPTKFKSDVYNVMSQLSALTGEVKVLSNGGTIDNTMSIDQFRSIMNSGAFASTESTDMPTMLKTIINDIDSLGTAVLISDMVYSPVGNAAPEVLLSQYSTEVAKILGGSGKAVSLIAATSEFIDKGGNISVKESPYYYLVIGDPANVAFVNNAISSLLQLKDSYVDNIVSGFDYKQARYSFGTCPQALQLDNQPTFYGLGDSDGDACEIKLKVDLSNYRWIITEKQLFEKCFFIKPTYGSVVNVKNIDIHIDNFDNKELKRNAYAEVLITVTNIPQDAEVLEWYINTDAIDMDITLMDRFFGAVSENDRTKSYSVDNFIKGMFQGGIVVKSGDKHNYILISKKG